MDPIVALLIALLSGGFVTAVAAFRKSGPESESISVATLRGIIEELRVETERKDRIIRELSERLAVTENRLASLERRATAGEDRASRSEEREGYEAHQNGPPAD